MRDGTDDTDGEYQTSPDVAGQHEGPLENDSTSVHSLGDDVAALFEDGKTYAQAEIAYQKSRAGFAANRAKGAIALGFGAFGVFHLALIAATVGLVLALIPLVGPWLATAIVTVMLIVVGIILLRLLKRRIDAIRAAFDENAK